MVNIVSTIRPSTFLQMFELEEVEKLSYSIINLFIMNCAIKIEKPVDGYLLNGSNEEDLVHYIIERINSYYVREPQEEEKQPTESEDNKTIK